MARAGKYLTITDLRIYPVKSCRGLSLETSQLTRQGLKYDRKWMFVDANNKFITIRQNARMTLINTAIDHEQQTLNITFPAVAEADLQKTQIRVPLEPDSDYLQANCEKIDVEIWEYPTDAWFYVSAEITDAVSAFFKTVDPDSDVKFVMKGPTARIARGNGAADQLGRTESVNFPDVLPILVATEESLQELNSRLKAKGEEELTIERFRPNIVVSSKASNYNDDDDDDEYEDDEINTNPNQLTPWEEDEWRTLRLNPPSPQTSTLTQRLLTNYILPSTLTNTIDMDVSARCARCQVPNVDPATGQKNAKQPWDTLVSYRRVDEGIKYKPCFGMLCCPRSEGVVSVGMDVLVLEVMEAAGGKRGGRHRYIQGF